MAKIELKKKSLEQQVLELHGKVALNSIYIANLQKRIDAILTGGNVG